MPLRRKRLPILHHWPLPLMLNQNWMIATIGGMIEKVEAWHCMYDMHDVFTVIVPDSDGKTLKAEAYNIYAEYAYWPAGATWQENRNWSHQSSN
jgi:hypothetical protein